MQVAGRELPSSDTDGDRTRELQVESLGFLPAETTVPLVSRAYGGRTRTLVVPNHACSHLHLDSIRLFFSLFSSFFFSFKKQRLVGESNPPSAS